MDLACGSVRRSVGEFGGPSYHRHVEIIHVPPRFGFRLHDIDLLKLEGSSIPDIGQDRLRLGAQPACVPGEQRNPAGLQESTC